MEFQAADANPLHLKMFNYAVNCLGCGDPCVEGRVIKFAETSNRGLAGYCVYCSAKLKDDADPALTEHFWREKYLVPPRPPLTEQDWVTRANTTALGLTNAADPVLTRTLEFWKDKLDHSCDKLTLGGVLSDITLERIDRCEMIHALNQEVTQARLLFRQGKRKTAEDEAQAILDAAPGS